ncbi:MAG: hypothetical protein ACR2LV_05040 [Solirubrobacteraceae bacterium]
MRRSLRLHKLTDTDAWSISFAGQCRAVFHLGTRQRPGRAHVIGAFIGTYAVHDRAYWPEPLRREDRAFALRRAKLLQRTARLFAVGAWRGVK